MVTVREVKIEQDLDLDPRPRHTFTWSCKTLLVGLALDVVLHRRV